MKLQRRSLFAGLMMTGLLGGSPLAFAKGKSRAAPAMGARGGPLVIAKQGSFAAGGTVIKAPGTFDRTTPSPAGQTLHGDHAYVFYQVPERARKLPIVMWHGFGQFSKTWESTPDGREGFQNIFLRRGFSTYVIDQPRRGRAGRTTKLEPVSIAPDEQSWFETFRVGLWPDYYPNVQFPRDPESLNQYFRQMTPNTGPFDIEVISDAVKAIYDRIGDGILMTHSQSGGPGWRAAIKSPNIKGIVSFEPGSNFIFPEGEVPPPEPSSAGPLPALGVPMAEFMKLTRIPIVIYYGDNIPTAPSPNGGADGWRARMIMARKWAATVNRHGGDATVIHLPEVGLHGNTHFPFSDLNNLQVADQVSMFLKRKGLDVMG